MKRGWFNQSYRHALAARGISSNRFFARKRSQQALTLLDKPGTVIKPEVIVKPRVSAEDLVAELERKDRERVKQIKQEERETLKRGPSGLVPGGRTFESPFTTFARERGEATLQEFVSKQVRESRDVPRVIKDVEAGDYSTALELLRLGHKTELRVVGKEVKPVAVPLTADERTTIKLALASQAVQLANVGIADEKLISALDSSNQKRVRDILSDVDRASKEATKSPLRREVERDLPLIAEQVLDAPVLGLEVAAEGYKEGAPGLFAFDKDAKGEFNYFKEPVSAKDSFDFLDTRGGVNPVLMKTSEKGKRASEVFADQVDSLFANAADLAKVDLSSFDRGNVAFKAGNRESLIDAIASLKSEEAKIRDRWDLVGQTHRNVVSAQNHSSAFSEPGLSNPLWGFGKLGGNQFVDQTKKINKVREALVKANDRVYSRRKMLEYRLQRLDASVPPERDVPRSVTRFESSSDNNFLSVQNPVVDSMKKGPVGFNGGLDEGY